MSEAQLILVNETTNCTLYTIKFLTNDVSEFENFYNKFKDNLELNPDLMRIIGFLSKIADFGSLERYFRPEGKMNDNVVALPVTRSKLRLYCLRLSDKILILGNGGIKQSRTYNENDELSGHVITLQKFDKLIKEGITNGSVTITEKHINLSSTIEL